MRKSILDERARMSTKMNDVNKIRGFTLVELLFVLVLIGIISAIAISAYFSYLDRARITVGIAALDELRKDLEMYHDQYQLYPVTINFSDFTDQNGNRVLTAMTPSALSEKIYSWDSYVADPETYTITARAMDSRHTVLTLTPTAVIR